MKVMDFLASPAGQIVDRMGFEGTHYNKAADGTLTPTPEIATWYARFSYAPSFKPTVEWRSQASLDFLASVNKWFKPDNSFVWPADLAPDTLGYQLPHYWHILVHGTRGLAETHLFAKEITVIKDGSTEPEKIPTGENRPRGYLDDYLQELRGKVASTGFSSAGCLRASRLALMVQAHAKS